MGSTTPVGYGQLSGILPCATSNRDTDTVLLSGLGWMPLSGIELSSGPVALALLLVGCAVVGLALALYATLHEPYRPVSRRHRLDVPAGWPGLSILHISDLHVRREDQRLVRAQIQALAGAEPDLLCVTGDVCEKADDVPLLVAVLAAARPRLGTFVILGNHEYGADLPPELRAQAERGMRRLVGRVLSLFAVGRASDGEEEGHEIGAGLRAAGFAVLHNEGTRVMAGGRSLWIAGCDSAWAGHADMPATMAGRRPGEACLALVHEPELAFAAVAEGADLVLAGHTHGGQVRLPLVGAPITHRVDPRLRVAHGFQRIGQAVLHITAGLGHTIALRFRCPPELAWLECVPAEPRPLAEGIAAADPALV
jgi:uncharacterized protein